MRGQKDMEDTNDDNWGLYSLNNILKEANAKVKDNLETLKKGGKVDKDVLEFMAGIVTVCEAQEAISNKITEVLTGESKKADQDRAGISALQSSVEEVANLHTNSRIAKLKADWAEELKQSTKQIMIHGVDFKEEIKGFHEIKKQAMNNLLGMATTKERLDGEFYRNVSIKPIGGITKKNGDKWTIPLVLDCDSKEKRIAVEQALKAEVKTVGIAYHWPKRLVNPIRTIREAYKTAGEVTVKETKVDLATADIRIRPSDDGTRIIVQYREKRNGENMRFNLLETLPVPFTAEERRTNGIRDKKIISAFPNVKFEF